MEGNVIVRVQSTSAFAGEQDVLTFTGSGTLKKTADGYRLRYHAVNDADGSPMDSEVTWERESGRAVVIQESGESGYGLLLDPRAATVTHIGGGLTLQVDTEHVGCAIGKREGQILFTYTLRMDKRPLSALHVCINLEEKKQ